MEEASLSPAAPAKKRGEAGIQARFSSFAYIFD
jgi:hypothetical protein